MYRQIHVRFFRPLLLMCRKYSDKVNSTPLPLRSSKPKSTRNKVKSFVDVKRVRAIGGKGGDGCISFLQLWANDRAGPDGGDGGNGGHVLLQASSNIKDLNHVSTVIKAENGEKGYNKDCFGKNAPHTLVEVPIGTIIRSKDTQVLGDLVTEGSIYILARGGAGGHGNAFFTSDTNQRPQVAQVGADGEDISYILELRSIASFGLLGMPNAGKSTLLQAISRARPKVAPYPFTTLQPHVGIVEYEDYLQIAVADLPGIIEDSHKNRGLGIEFLRHAERCKALIIVVDASDSPSTAVDIITHEVSCFSRSLAKKPVVLVANKIDLPEAKDNLAELELQKKDLPIIPISAKFGTNVRTLLIKIRQIFDKMETDSSPER